MHPGVFHNLNAKKGMFIKMKQYMVGTDLSKAFGEDVVFENASFSLHEQQRIALIGPNGSGKSTFLKIIAGIDIPDSGSINITSGATVGYASQHVSFTASQTIKELMFEVIADRLLILDEVAKLEQQFATTEFGTEAFDKLSNAYERMQAQITQEGTHQLDTKIKMLLTKFGFDEATWDKDVLTLSGGQQIRLHLARLLLQEPDVLLLDEPTNHLDIETIIWLENYLSSYKKAIIFISHDQSLLQSLSTQVWQIISEELIKYNGTYDNYKVFIAEKMAFLAKEQAAISKEKAKLADFVDRNLTRASTTGRAQSARTRLEKMEDVKQLKIQKTLQPFNLPIARTSGKFVYKLEDLGVGYTKQLFPSLHLDIERYERIALVGRNGIGKSTLLSTMHEDLQPFSGTCVIGHHVDSAFFLQQQVFASKNVSVYDTFSDVYPDANRAVIYPILAKFGFSQEEVHLNNATLSGGEKQRLLLALLYYQKANTLLLDEPTNHLDIPSKEALTESLQAFDGTIVFASHDRNFIEKLATKIIFIDDNVVEYFDTYNDFLRYTQQDQLETVTTKETVVTSSQLSRQEQKQKDAVIRRITREIERLETEIETIETKIAEHNEQLLIEDVYSDFEKSQEHSDAIQTLEANLETIMDAWEAEQEALETAQ